MGPQPFWHQGLVSWKMGWGWFQDDLSTLHLLSSRSGRRSPGGITSNGERLEIQMKLYCLACCSPPAVGHALGVGDP